MIKKYKLLLKQHYETGISYLCVTQKEDYITYKGSGIRWKRLIKKIPSKILTNLLHHTDNLEEHKIYCELYSKLLQIPENPDFANIIPELGIEDNKNNFKIYYDSLSEEDKSKINEKRRRSILKRWEDKTLKDLFIERMRKYCEKHNVDNVMQIEEVKNKNIKNRKQTLQNIYGVEHNMQIPSVSDEVRNKRQATLKEKYGVEYPLQIPGLGMSAKEKREQTMLEKYGVRNISQLPEVAKARGEKISRTLKNRNNSKGNNDE